MPKQEQTIRQSSLNPKFTPEEVLNSVFRCMDNPKEVFWEDTDCGKAVAKTYEDLYGYDVMRSLNYKGHKETLKVVGENIYNPLVRTLVCEGFRVIDREVSGSIGTVKMVNGEVAIGLCVKPNLWAVRHDKGFSLLNTSAEAVLYNYKDNK